MLVFTVKSRLYKGGLCLLFFAVFVYTLGYTAPYWASVSHTVQPNNAKDSSLNGSEPEQISTPPMVEPPERVNFAQALLTCWQEKLYPEMSDIVGQSEISIYEGPWLRCTELTDGDVTFTSCWSLKSDLASWFHAVRALLSVAFLVYVAACAFAILTNFCPTVPLIQSRVLEFLVANGAVIALLGVICYGSLRHEKSIFESQVRHDEDLKLAATLSLNWALFFSAFGSFLAIVAAILIGIGNKEISQSDVVGLSTSG